MIRNSLAGWTVGALFCLTATVALAQQQSAAELYGRGVSAYFAGDAQQAIALLDKTIKRNPDDPRAYFFRGLARFQQGDLKAAQADFAKGAEIEVTAKTHVYDVDDALQRIQGSVRIEIENQRSAARKAALERRRKEEQVRYERLKRREKDVLYNPKQPVPKIDFPLPKPTVKVDPFASGLVLTGGKQVAVKAAPAIAPAAAAGGSRAKPRDPFAAKSGAAAKPVTDPFATKPGGTPPVPTATKSKPAANPFGDLKPAAKAPAAKTPAAKPAAPPAKPATDPFGIGAAKPAAPKAGAADKKKAASGAASKQPPPKKPASPPADDPFK